MQPHSSSESIPQVAPTELFLVFKFHFYYKQVAPLGLYSFISCRFRFTIHTQKIIITISYYRW